MSEYKHYFTTNLPPHAKVVKTLMFFAIPILLIGGGISLLYIHAKTHLPLRTTINGIVLNNLPQQEATHLLTQQIAQPTKFSIIIKNETTAVASSSDELGAHYNPTQAIKQVMEIEKHTHTRDTVYSVLNRFFSPQEIQLPIEYEDSKLEEFIAAFKEKVDNPPIEPQVKMTISGRPETLTVHPGQLGQIVAVPEALAARDSGAGPHGAQALRACGAPIDSACDRVFLPHESNPMFGARSVHGAGE